MKYVDIDALNEYTLSNLQAKDMVSKMDEEVNEFFENFSDSPKNMSRWAHHYFCKDEGGLLIFDVNEPKKHVCSICGKVYENDDLLDGVWHTMYRNLAVVNAWKSALLYRLKGDKKYFDNVINLTLFYADNYSLFKLHNKEGLEFDDTKDAEWGVSRIMPQALNEAILIIRLINALEMVKNDLPVDFIETLKEKLFDVAFEEMKPQVDSVHNIRCWLNSAIGVMGLFANDKEMIDFAFDGEYNIQRQLKEGVTADDFWYEGSIHYNFFLLEGVVNLLLFSKLYGYDFAYGENVVRKMLIKAFNYAFDNNILPNPNDGWPNVNLKTYSYIYSMAIKVYGADSDIADVLSDILNKEGKRGTVPLSKPYYYKNDISLEELLFAQGVRDRKTKTDKISSYNFGTSYCGMIKNDNVNVFIKYGHNGPSHAHPDKMNIEVMLKGRSLTRDLSNAGYGNPFCNEWHRVTASHNTVVVDGKSHINIFDGGESINSSDKSISVKCSNVYDGVDFARDIILKPNGFTDEFCAYSNEAHTYDYIFHVEGNLLSDLDASDENLGYKDNGYQHIKGVKRINQKSDILTIKWDIKGVIISSIINLTGKELYLAQSPDNPVINDRYTMIIRKINTDAVFNVDWELED